MNKHYSKTFYSKIANIYDKTRWEEKGKILDKIQKELINKILLKIKIEKKSKILDVGAGTGRFVILFAKKGFDTYGIDISKDMLEKAKIKAKGINNLHLKQADAENIPYPKNYFDFIISYRVLIHIPKYEKVINEVYRILKSNKYCLLEFNNKFSLSGVGKIYRIFRKILRIPTSTDTIIISKKELCKCFLNSKFKIEKIYHQYVIPEIIFRHVPSFMENSLIKIDELLSKSILGNLSTKLIILAKK